MTQYRIPQLEAWGFGGRDSLEAKEWNSDTSRSVLRRAETSFPLPRIVPRIRFIGEISWGMRYSCSLLLYTLRFFCLAFSRLEGEGSLCLRIEVGADAE